MKNKRKNKKVVQTFSKSNGIVESTLMIDNRLIVSFVLPVHKFPFVLFTDPQIPICGFNL